MSQQQHRERNTRNAPFALYHTTVLFPYSIHEFHFEAQQLKRDLKDEYLLKLFRLPDPKQKEIDLDKYDYMDYMTEPREYFTPIGEKYTHNPQFVMHGEVKKKRKRKRKKSRKVEKISV